MHGILADLVDDKLKRLSAVRRIEHYRLVQVYALLGKLPVVDQHHQRVIVVFRVGLAQRQAHGSHALKSLGLRQVKLEVVALSALFELDQLVMSLGNRSAQLIPRRAQVALKVGAGFLEVLLRARELLLFLIELRLHLLPARVFSSHLGRSFSACCPCAPCL